jgi:hypothetical protein
VTKLTPAAEALVQEILARFGSRLGDDQKVEVRRLMLENVQKPGDALRAFRLENGDEPALVLHIRNGGDRP